MTSASQDVSCAPPATSPPNNLLSANGNNFNLEQYQNFESVIGTSQGTPLSPFNNPLINSYNNTLSNIQSFTQSRGANGGGGDCQGSLYYSPMQFASPGIPSNNNNHLHYNHNNYQGTQQHHHNGLYLGNQANQGASNNLNMNSFPFYEFDGSYFNANTFAPHNNNLPFQNASYSRLSSLRNTPLHPMACASPVVFPPNTQAKGTNIVLTPKMNGRLSGNTGNVTNNQGDAHHGNSHNVNPLSTSNNIFNANNYYQQVQSQSGNHLNSQYMYQSNSPNVRERLGSLISYEYYNNNAQNDDNNDLFDDMDLKDWVDDNNNTNNNNNNNNSVKEEDERSQSFHSLPHKKFKRDYEEIFLNQQRNINSKLKTSSKSNNHNKDMLQYQDDMNSCTYSEHPNTNLHPFGSASNQKYSKDRMSQSNKISSAKTVKQNFNISPGDTDKFSQGSITPVKQQMNNNLEKSYNYVTPSASRQKIKEEDECYEETLVQSTILQSTNSKQAAKDEKGGRNGLRILSEKVRDIVCVLKETTYKQVAEHLIKDMETTKQNNLEFAKDEQNVKRRVYDALNVLIAANVLSKEGKKVKTDHLLPKGNATQQNPHLKKEYLEKALILKRTRLVRKEETINDLITKLVALRCLCDRNQSVEMEIMKSGGDPALGSGKSLQCITLNNSRKEESDDFSQRKLRFPFIGMYSPHNNQRISFKKFNNGLLISSIERLNLMGDIDILVRLYSTRSAQNIIQDKMKYLNPSLVEYLKNLPKFQDESQQDNQDDIEDSCEQPELQMEITITNNKIIQQHLPNENRNNSNQLTFQQQQQQHQQYRSQQFQQTNDNHINTIVTDCDASSETVKRNKQITTNLKNPQQMIGLLPEFGEFEDSNQLVNEYIA